ncbi:DUF4391 domain-containing protein [Parvularcula sp. LCG005]|uniref:DUF4391 domain-containing protein n=1 Tax=Parvularcula sp. LCG005 TaxID=3078805 RepID=UPI002941ED63|nr:DUF4391 domain-containing protein [Parvularcula sp. LCG005]WOI52587.1 DUF4391 domain-containing protein [Parvularcula sp. LCG005]
MTACYDYPKAARFGRMVPKTKIYDAARAPEKLRQLFVDQVDRITWAYKVAPETINLNAVPGVPEIQVFEVRLRAATLEHAVLAAIDKAVAYPILFELIKGGERQMIAAYKRPSEADSARWVVSEYFAAGWEPVDNPRKPIPRVLDLGALYDRVLSELMPVRPLQGEKLPDRVARIEAIWATERDVARIKARLAREKQFNKRIVINAELRRALGMLEALRNEQ